MMTDRIAASATQAAVQTAVNLASDGDRVLIPNGTATWSSGITTTKQIIIRAQNYTPTSGGTMTRSLTITNNSSSPLFQFTTGNSYHVGIGGIRFNEGSATTNYAAFSGSGSKPPLIFDCGIENRNRSGSSQDVALLRLSAAGSVMWNCYLDGSSYPDGEYDLGVSIASVSFYLSHPRSWNTNSTIGMDDPTGLINQYFEDCTFKNAGTFDGDDASRGVYRYNTIDGTGIITHGNVEGGRSIEAYNNTLQVTALHRNFPNGYFWFRSGHGVFTNNVVNNTVSPSDYGNTLFIRMGDNENPTAYPEHMQPGWGYENGSDTLDPVRAWNNTGSQATSYSILSAWSSAIQVGRELVFGTARPGYTKYTYPHPLRSVIEGGASPPVGVPVLSVR